MLTEVCQELKNWFDTGLPKWFGEISIRNNGDVISIDSGDAINLQDGQYFRIVGSVFNDGVHQYPTNNLCDETFDGAIWAMAVPPSVIDIVSEISDWVTKYNPIIGSPYSSESFGGYSYSKASGGASSGSGGIISWKNVFHNRLNYWRKI